MEKRIVDWRLDVYGDGERNSYEQQALVLGLDKSRYRLHERTDNVEKVYTESSLFVLSSRFEGFGMVIVEAMACGLPCVSFDCPSGPSEIVENGVSGLLAKEGDVIDLSSKIEWMITHEKERKEMGIKAHQAVARYKKEKVMKEWEKAYMSLI